MSTLVEGLRDGRFLTRQRMALVGFALLAASLFGIVIMVATSDGLNDRLGRPLGTDFSNVYAAGISVLEGHATAPFDPARQFAREQALFGQATQFYGWHYPPFFLGLAALLALMPFALALLVWQSVTLGLYVWAMRSIFTLPSPLWGGSRTEGARGGGHGEIVTTPLPTASRSTSPTREEVKKEISRDYLWLLLTLAFPAVFINLGHGHNGFLTAALMTGALLQLDRRPVLAGVLFGLIAYKPQFGVLVPFVLAASGRWRTFVSAAVTVTLLALAVTLVFGVDVWRAFLDSMAFTREVVLERGDTGWHKIQSMFSWARMWGAPLGVAYFVQATVTLCIGGALVWLWRRPAPFALKAAALLIATLLATPYSLDYDLMLLAPAIAFLAADGFARGFAPWEKTLLAALWIVPLLARSVAQFTLIPLAVPLMLAAFCFVLHRAMRARTAEERGVLRAAP